jgi:hypothetical protein
MNANYRSTLEIARDLQRIADHLDEEQAARRRQDRLRELASPKSRLAMQWYFLKHDLAAVVMIPWTALKIFWYAGVELWSWMCASRRSKDV